MIANQATIATGVALMVGAGLVLSNLLRDLGAPRAFARYVAPWFAGAAFLIAAFFLEPGVAIPLAIALTIVMVALKLFRSSALRGVEGRFTSQTWAEITFSVAGVTSLAIGWGLLGNPWLGFLPLAFMAWGDTASGLTRSMLPRSKAGSVWPSLAMVTACLAVALLYQPYWIGAVGAVAATLAERKQPTVGPWWDDNTQEVAVSLTLMSILTVTFVA